MSIKIQDYYIFIFLINLIIKYILFLEPNTAFQNLNFSAVILALELGLESGRVNSSKTSQEFFWLEEYSSPGLESGLELTRVNSSQSWCAGQKTIRNFTKTGISIVPAGITNRVQPALSTTWSRFWLECEFDSSQFELHECESKL